MTEIVTSQKGSQRPVDLGQEGPGADFDAQAPLRNSWSTLATEYSTVPHELYPWDRNHVRAIRLYDPDFVPVWVRRVYRLPDNSERIMGYHGIGRKIWHPVSDPGEPMPVNVATSFGPASPPIYLGRVLDGSSFGGDYRRFIKFDARIVEISRSAWWQVKLSTAETDSRNPQSLRKMGAKWARDEMARRRAATEEAEAGARYSLNADRNMIERARDGETFYEGPTSRPVMSRPIIIAGR